MKRLLFVLALLAIAACSDPADNSAEGSFELAPIPLKEKLKNACEDDYLSGLGLNPEEIDVIQSTYQESNYKPYWVNDSSLNDNGKELLKVLKRPYLIALPEKRKLLIESNNFIQDEIAITLAVSRAGNDLKNGFLDLAQSKLKPLSVLNANETILINRSLKQKDSSDIRSNFLIFAPNDSTYRRLFYGLIELSDRLPYDTSHYQVKSIKLDSSGAFNAAKKALMGKGYLANDYVKNDSLAIDSVLKVFQTDNGLKPDGKIGKYTARSLNESSAEKIHRVILAMEKIRTRQAYPGKYIEINLPEYYLRFYEQDTLRSQHRIIIGTTENQTPELESKLSKIIVYPYWSVPYSISSKEILPAVKNNIGYLARNNYKIYRNGEEVDPYTVNWRKIGQNSFPYKVVQEPGPKNSLGILKFDFSNSYSVYFHDTPSKSLFSTDIRSYSHGCMRTQYPIDLAKKILEYDSIPRKHNDVIPDTLDSLLARGKNYTIKILDRIPIYIIYQTVTADRNGMIIHLDIYDRDKKYLKTIMN